MNDFEVQYLAELQLYSGNVRLWSGAGDYEFDGRTYRGGMDAVIASDSMSLSLGADGRALVGTKVVGRKVTVRYVARRDSEDWTVLPFVLSGVLDNPRIERGVYVVDVSPPVYGETPTGWTQEEHVSQPGREGDTFFQQKNAISQGVESIWFPDIPVFDENGQYDYRVINDLRDAEKTAERKGGRPTGAGIVQAGDAPTHLRSARSFAPTGL